MAGVGGDEMAFKMFSVPYKDDDSCTVTFKAETKKGTENTAMPV